MAARLETPSVRACPRRFAGSGGRGRGSARAAAGGFATRKGGAHNTRDRRVIPLGKLHFPKIVQTMSTKVDRPLRDLCETRGAMVLDPFRVMKVRLRPQDISNDFNNMIRFLRVKFRPSRSDAAWERGFRRGLSNPRFAAASLPSTS